MNALLQRLVTLGPLGYLPASGTLASLVTVPFAYLLQYYLSYWYLSIILLGYIVALYSIKQVLGLFKEADPSEIVIDEVIGCFFVFYTLPFCWITWTIAFILFRVFDISKIGPVGWSEKLPGETGIMVDDVVAGILSNVCIKLLVYMAVGF